MAGANMFMSGTISRSSGVRSIEFGWETKVLGELTRLISCAIDRKDSLPSPSWRFNVRQCIEAMRIRSLAFSISCPLDVENSIRTSSSSRTFAGGNIYGNRRIMVGETRSFYLCLDDSRVLVYTLKQWAAAPLHLQSPTSSSKPQSLNRRRLACSKLFRNSRSNVFV